MKKMSKKNQLQANGGKIKVYLYTYYCGGCGWPFVGTQNWTTAEVQHGAHLSTKLGKKCMGKGLYRQFFGFKIIG